MYPGEMERLPFFTKYIKCESFPWKCLKSIILNLRIKKAEYLTSMNIIYFPDMLFLLYYLSCLLPNCLHPLNNSYCAIFWKEIISGVSLTKKTNPFLIPLFNRRNQDPESLENGQLQGEGCIYARWTWAILGQVAKM